MNRLTSAPLWRATPVVAARRARARPGPLPHGRCPRGRTSGVGEGRKTQGARELRSSQPPPPGARGRARASHCRPPLSTRPSSRSRRWGRGCPRRSPFPSASAGDRLAVASPRASWPGAHHVSGSEKEIVRRAEEDESRCSCCRDPTERGLSRPLPFSMIRTMRGGASFRRSSCGPTGNEVRGCCTALYLAYFRLLATLHTGKCSSGEAGLRHGARAHWPSFPGNALSSERPKSLALGNKSGK